MSFILDALRKSEQSRQERLGAPTSAPLPSAAPPRRPTLSLAIAAAIVVALSSIGWWQTGSTPAKASAPPTPPPHPLPAPREALAAPSPPSPPGVVEPALAALPPPTASRPMPARRAGDQPPLRIARTMRMPHAVDAPPTATATDAPAPTGETADPPTLDELSPAMRGEIPKLTVAAHAWSPKPKGSYVFVNDRMLREGDALAPDLKLERITADGMIFSYRGHRFRRGLQP